MHFLVRGVASVGGVGYLPFAPGTWASLCALLGGIYLLALGVQYLLLGIVIIGFLGFFSVRVLQGYGDASWIVIDEVVGQWIALIPLVLTDMRSSAPLLLCAFAAFRLFDIWKPGVIGFINQRSGPWAVFADDMLAGMAAGALVVIVQYLL